MNAENIAQELKHQLGNYGFELDATTLEALAFLVEEVAPEGRERVADFFHALWATSDYWGYRYVAGLSAEELGDYVAEHAQEWDNLDPAAPR